MKDQTTKIQRLLAEVWNSLVETAATPDERTKAVQLHRRLCEIASESDV